MKKLNSEERFLIHILVLVAIGLMFIVYGHYMEKHIMQNLTIENVTENAVCINYGGEVHEYLYN